MRPSDSFGELMFRIPFQPAATVVVRRRDGGERADPGPDLSQPRCQLPEHGAAWKGWCRRSKLIKKNVIPEKPGEKESIISIFFMSLLNGKNFLDNHQFFFFINIVKCSVTAGNVKPVNYNPSS